MGTVSPEQTPPTTAATLTGPQRPERRPPVRLSASHGVTHDTHGREAGHHGDGAAIAVQQRESPPQTRAQDQGHQRPCPPYRDSNADGGGTEEDLPPPAPVEPGSRDEDDGRNTEPRPQQDRTHEAGFHADHASRAGASAAGLWVRTTKSLWTRTTKNPRSGSLLSGGSVEPTRQLQATARCARGGI